MSSEASHWLGGHNSWLTFVGISAIMVILLIPFIMFTLYKYCGVRFQFQKVNSILAKLLLINKTTETVQPALAQQANGLSTKSFDILDQTDSNSTYNNGTDFYLLLVHKTYTMDL